MNPLDPVAALGRRALHGPRALGHAMLFLVESVALLFAPPLRPRRLLAALHFIGARSVGVVALTGLFTGMVLALQGAYTLRRFGSEGLLGPAVALGLIRELGPVLTALMVVARAGSAIAAELGLLRVTEQIDAIDVMGLSPRGLLVGPRIAGAALALPLLGAIFDVAGIAGGYLVGVRLLGVNEGAFFGAMRRSVELADVRGGAIKALGFGVLASWICTYRGFHATGGAEGVGRATTRAVVLSSVVVLAWDYVMTALLFT